MVVAWVGWSVLDVVSVDLAFAETYRFRIDVVGWRDTWPVLRWLPGWIGIVGGCVQRKPFDRSRIQSCLWLAGLLLGLRLVSLLPGVGTAAPVLGLVWSGNVSWALSLALLVYILLPAANFELASRSRTVGFGLLVCFGILYAVYAVFFVRTTSLHGDEPQYLMTTQSLLQDGDIDLANTTKGSVLEFHQMNVRPHRAPGSPQDKIHSAHPVGFAAMLAPVYWLGLEAIGHPRLACALLVALTSAISVYLAHRWMIQLGIAPAGALITSIAVGCSPLMFLFSNQIYPEVFALVAALLVLTMLASPPSYGSFGLLVLGSVGILVALPMLHQRLLPMAGFLGLMMFLHVRDLPERASIFTGSGAILAVATLAYVFYHLHFSGDIWGPFKPGNADVLDFEHAPTALFGQWFDARVGLINNSPIFLGALVGLAAMALSRDRRLLIVIGIYATTACVNALSNDWRFGYCLPSRFMITALPALLIPLAHTMDRALNQSVLLTFVLMFGFCVGWDSNHQALVLTEGAYDGAHLIFRALDRMYPAGIHFPLLKDVATVPWLDVVSWAAGIAILLSLGRVDNRKVALLLIGSVVIVPILAAPRHVHRLKTHVAPALRRFSSTDVEAAVLPFRKQGRFGLYNGTTQENEEYVARPTKARPGVAGYSELLHALPLGLYRLTIPATASPSDGGSPGGYYVVARRHSGRSQLNHQTRYGVPITSDGSHASVRFAETSGRDGIQHFVMYREGADLRFGDATLVYQPLQLRETGQLEFTSRLDLDTRGGKGFYHGLAVNLEPGFYRFAVEFESVDPSVWVDRESDPVVVTLFGDVTDLQDGKRRSLAWQPMLGRAIELPVLADVERPAVEAYLSPIWAHVPFADQMKFNFEIDSEQTLFVGIYYSGQHSLVLKSIHLHRRLFWSRLDGSRYVVPPKPVGQSSDGILGGRAGSGGYVSPEDVDRDRVQSE